VTDFQSQFMSAFRLWPLGLTQYRRKIEAPAKMKKITTLAYMYICCRSNCWH